MLSLAKEENMPKLTDSQLIVLSTVAARIGPRRLDRRIGIDEPRSQPMCF
jgi:hypothetical protein